MRREKGLLTHQAPPATAVPWAVPNTGPWATSTARVENARPIAAQQASATGVVTTSPGMEWQMLSAMLWTAASRICVETQVTLPSAGLETT